MAVRRIAATVRGRVQGVGFRYFARQAARRLSLSGWVRNRPDGSVHTEAQGDAPRIDAFIEAIGKGPSAARVTELQIQDMPPQVDTGPFEFRR